MTWRVEGWFPPCQARHLLAFGPAEPPGRDHERGHDGDPGEGEHGDARLASRTRTLRLRRPAGANRSLLLPDREPRVVLVDERLAVEPERLGVRAQEPADVRRRGQDVELLVLERAEVLRADLGELLELWEVEALADAGLAEAGADVEHARRIVDGRRRAPVAQSREPTYSSKP